MPHKGCFGIAFGSLSTSLDNHAKGLPKHGRIVRVRKLWIVEFIAQADKDVVKRSLFQIAIELFYAIVKFSIDNVTASLASSQPQSNLQARRRSQAIGKFNATAVVSWFRKTLQLLDIRVYHIRSRKNFFSCRQWWWMWYDGAFTCGIFLVDIFMKAKIVHLGHIILNGEEILPDRQEGMTIGRPTRGSCRVFCHGIGTVMRALWERRVEFEFIPFPLCVFFKKRLEEPNSCWEILKMKSKFELLY